VSKLNDGTADTIKYLLTMDILISQKTELAVLVAQGDIGQNELTGKK
jgi:NAD+--asparagine ADP-ribosyltransferase